MLILLLIVQKFRLVRNKNDVLLRTCKDTKYKHGL